MVHHTDFSVPEGEYPKISPGIPENPTARVTSLRDLQNIMGLDDIHFDRLHFGCYPILRGVWKWEPVQRIPLASSRQNCGHHFSTRYCAKFSYNLCWSHWSSDLRPHADSTELLEGVVYGRPDRFPAIRSFGISAHFGQYGKLNLPRQSIYKHSHYSLCTLLQNWCEAAGLMGKWNHQDLTPHPNRTVV